MATGQIKDPYGTHRFLVEIDGILRASFRECSGLDSTIDTIDYREGGDNTSVRKLPGLTKHSNLQLRWGITDDTELYDWHRAAVTGDVQRRNGSIVLLDNSGEERKRWNFVRAWPSSWKGPDLKAESSEVAIEQIEITHEGLEAG